MHRYSKQTSSKVAGLQGCEKQHNQRDIWMIYDIYS